MAREQHALPGAEMACRNSSSAPRTSRRMRSISTDCSPVGAERRLNSATSRSSASITRCFCFSIVGAATLQLTQILFRPACRWRFTCATRFLGRHDLSRRRIPITFLRARACAACGFSRGLRRASFSTFNSFSRSRRSWRVRPFVPASWTSRFCRSGSLHHRHGIGAANFAHALDAVRYRLARRWPASKRRGSAVLSAPGRTRLGSARAASRKACAAGRRRRYPRVLRSDAHAQHAWARVIGELIEQRAHPRRLGACPHLQSPRGPSPAAAYWSSKRCSSLPKASGNTSASITPVRSCSVKIAQRAPRRERIGRICTMIPATTMSSSFVAISMERKFDRRSSSFSRPAYLSSGWPEM